MALLPMIASAKEVEIDGINYYIDVEKKTANVAYNGKYTGTQIIIPSSILYEGDSYSVIGINTMAFSNNRDLISVEIPNSVTSIGGQAFYNCRGLTSLSFPQSVKTIEGNAFGGCSGLTFIKVYRNRPIAITDEFDSAFTDVDKETCILYVPKGTATMYMSAPGWMEFENIVEFEEESAINQLDVTSDEDVDWYTLDGRKLEGQPTEKGIYIINGKKIYVK